MICDIDYDLKKDFNFVSGLQCFDEIPREDSFCKANGWIIWFSSSYIPDDFRSFTTQGD